MQPPTQLPAWRALSEHQRAAQGFSLRDLLDADPARFNTLALRCADILFDFSRHPVTNETLRLLAELARQRDLPAWIERLFCGDKVNATESRAALHTALRSREAMFIDGQDIGAQIARTRRAIERLCEDIWSGERCGSGGHAFTDIVNIGIGGSDLGPAFVCEALAPYARREPRLHFVSNVDGMHLATTLRDLEPEATLFIISSKSFSTLETLANARSARAWLEVTLGKGNTGPHFIAITANAPAAREFGVAEDAVFEFWEWVGGRYSLWSAVGLPIALATGSAVFDALLGGAHEMDEHFRRTPLERNIPVLAGLLDVWQVNFLGARTQAVLAYDQRLKRLPEYLQQLMMESNGKSVARNGAAVDYATAPVIFGAAGTPGQHSFFQLLHQGTQVIPADFIACCTSDHDLTGHHAALLANCIAQTEALARGRTAGEAAAEMRARGMSGEQIREQLPHRTFAGNRPTTTVLLPRLDAHALGALLAFYEHRTYVQSVIWNINAFDQWGVELGKQLAARLLRDMEGSTPNPAYDASTAGLLNHIRRNG